MSERSTTVENIDEHDVHGVLHSPDGPPVGSLALTHGAGGDCTAKLLVNVAERWSTAGFVVLRFDLAFRRLKSSGPPHPSRAAGDRESIAAALERLAGIAPDGTCLLGGHSYGGRQASMLCAERPDVAAGLVLLSYPLHPPGKPEKVRTAHLPNITVPTLGVSGTKDPFGTPAELRAAIGSIPAKTRFVEVAGAGHDLSAAKHATADVALDAAADLFGILTRDRSPSAG